MIYAKNPLRNRACWVAFFEVSYEFSYEKLLLKDIHC